MLFGSIVNFVFKIELLEAADKDSTNFLKPKKAGISREQEIFDFLDSRGYL